MAKLLFKHSESAYGKFRVFIQDTTSAVGAGLTGLTFSTTGLSIHTIADNEASVTSYTAAGSTIETITTLGTFAAPTATKCRFKEIDSTNLPGWYEIQVADARWAVASARAVQVQVTATGGFCAPVEIQLALFDVNDATPDVNVAQLSGDSTAADNAEAFFDGTGYAGTNNVIPTVTTTGTATNVTTVNGLAAGVITAAAIATGAIDADAIATDAVTEIQSGLSTIAAADVWAYATRTLTSGGAIAATISSVVAENLSVEMYGGYDYTTNSGAPLEWNLTGAPILTGGTVDIVYEDASETSLGWSVTVANGGTTSPTITAEVSGTQTAALKAAGKTKFPYRMKATLSNSAQRVLVTGVVTIR